MLTITRRQAQTLRAVLRRAFGNFRGTGPVLGFIADAEGLRVRAMSADAAVEYRVPDERTAETLWLPFQFLADCEAKKDEPVELAVAGKGRVSAQWRDGSVPQITEYDSAPPRDADKFPALPETLVENPPTLLRALVDAYDTCDPESARYALGHIQLQHDGTVGATDGRQLLVQSGFVFPWDDAVLIPRNRIFSAPELSSDEPVKIGKSGDWVAMGIGSWTIWLAINKDGKFPDLSRHIPRSDNATARCRFSSADAKFLAGAIPRLPSAEEFNFPITLDLNGSIAVRARAADQACPTEVVLKGSSWTGEPIRLNTNRKYLARALKLGFQELLVFGSKVPVVCRDDYRQYGWALLEPESAIPPADNAIRIESPQATTDRSIPIPQPTRRTSTVSESSTTPNGNGHATTNGSPASANGHAAKTNGQARKTTGRKAESQDTTALIEQAEKLRTALHNLMHEASGLVKALKQHRRQNRASRPPWPRSSSSRPSASDPPSIPITFKPKGGHTHAPQNQRRRQPQDRRQQLRLARRQRQPGSRAGLQPDPGARAAPGTHPPGVPPGPTVRGRGIGPADRASGQDNGHATAANGNGITATAGTTATGTATPPRAAPAAAGPPPARPVPCTPSPTGRGSIWPPSFRTASASQEPEELSITEASAADRRAEVVGQRPRHREVGHGDRTS